MREHMNNHRFALALQRKYALIEVTQRPSDRHIGGLADQDLTPPGTGRETSSSIGRIAENRNVGRALLGAYGANIGCAGMHPGTQRNPWPTWVGVTGRTQDAL